MPVNSLAQENSNFVSHLSLGNSVWRQRHWRSCLLQFLNPSQSCGLEDYKSSVDVYTAYSSVSQPFARYVKPIILLETSVTSRYIPTNPLFLQKVHILGEFAKLRKTTISFVMSVCPAVRPSTRNILPPTGRIFMKFYIWVLFENRSRKF